MRAAGLAPAVRRYTNLRTAAVSPAGRFRDGDMGSLRVAFFTGNHNYAIDGVALTSNRQVAYLESLGIPVRVYAPTKATPVLEHSGTLVSVPSVPFTPPYKLAVGITPAVRRDLAAFQPT